MNKGKVRNKEGDGLEMLRGEKQLKMTLSMCTELVQAFVMSS